MMIADREQEILSVAEQMIRQGGYHSFSFRNIAERIGIKSSSVHYHFANKEALGVAVTRRYTERFLNALGNPEQELERGKNPLVKYLDLFQAALERNGGMCLCGIFGTESNTLPDEVAQEARHFFTLNIEWLTSAYLALGEGSKAQQKAMQLLALLEGAMLISHTLNDTDVFLQATESIRAELWAER